MVKIAVSAIVSILLVSSLGAAKHGGRGYRKEVIHYPKDSPFWVTDFFVKGCRNYLENCPRNYKNQLTCARSYDGEFKDFANFCEMQYENCNTWQITSARDYCSGTHVNVTLCSYYIEHILPILMPFYDHLRLTSGMNLTLNASARWVIEASRGVQNPGVLLEKFSQNRKVDDPTRTVLLTFYGILVVVGALGNVLVVVSVVRKPVMRTARNMFIVNLAVSDALVCCVGTPLTLMELLTKHWPLLDWPSLCKACGAIQAISIFVSTISITAIALDRYQLIVYPTRAALQTAGVVFTMACIWCAAFALASPLYIFRSLKTHKLGLVGMDSLSFCIEDWPISDGRAIYSVFSLIFQYLVPVVVVTIAHVQIHRRLRGRRRATRKTPAILVAIAVTYVISWLPLNVFNLVADFSPEPMMDEKSMTITYSVCHMLGMSSAVSNPLLYGWLNDNFRKEFEEILWCGRREPASPRRRKDTELTALAEHTLTHNTKTSHCSQIF